MREREIDILVLQSSSDWVGGYVRWFTNEPATNGYPTSVLFPLEGGMSIIEQGPFNGIRESDDTEVRETGIARRLATPNYPSVHYTAGYDADIAAREVRRMGARRVGLVAPAAMYHSFGQRLCELLAGDVAIIDATDPVDRIKAIKSAEERELIRSVAAMQDQVMAGVREFIRPGLKDFEVASYAQYLSQQFGSEQGLFLCSSAGAGEAASFRPRFMQGRTLERGDVYSLLVECNGKGGFYTELSRIFVLGRVPAELREAQAAVVEAQAKALTLLKPGASCREIFLEHNAYLRSRSLPEERRLSMHGMGYDMVERPLIRQDETMRIEEHMAIVCHPGILTERLFAHNTDVYLIEKHGASDCLHRTPKEIVEI
ncbi:MAG: M24 family metallopeptidase [Pseudomonadota bacterium]|jgi:Xaa-Pro aminopeptidase|nr:M24 family metallopeptidase [Pseudomonadota bacterium]